MLNYSHAAVLYFPQLCSIIPRRALLFPDVLLICMACIKYKISMKY